MWVHDLQVAIRSALKASAFSSAVVVVLGIAIAAATAQRAARTNISDTLRNE